MISDRFEPFELLIDKKKLIDVCEEFIKGIEKIITDVENKSKSIKHDGKFCNPTCKHLKKDDVFIYCDLFSYSNDDVLYDKCYECINSGECEARDECDGSNIFLRLKGCLAHEIKTIEKNKNE